jgi:hypothetical protein
MTNIGTFNISRHNLITCIASTNAHNQNILDMILNDTDESYKICIFRQPPPIPFGFVKCETCNFEQPEHIDICQMCKIPYKKSLLGLRYNSSYVPDLASITLSRYSQESVPITSSDPELLVTTESNSIPELNVLAEYNNTNEPVNMAMGGGGPGSEYQDIPLTCKLYIKNFKYNSRIIRYFIEHFNFAICRARGIDRTNHHISGMYPLSKTSAMIVFSSEFNANIAIQLDNNILWNNEYIRIQRPQGYKSNTYIFTNFKLNIVREIQGVDYIEQLQKQTLKEKEKEKKKNSNPLSQIHPVYPYAPKKKVVKPVLTPQQNELVESLRKTLRKGPLECLEILCCHDGRETSVYFEPLAELCSILHDHKVFSCEVKPKQILVKGFGQNISFNIEKGRAGDHIKLHSISDVRALMRAANFPESGFN